MVTSLPSFSLSLSLSLSLCISLSLSPKVPHAQYRKRFRASYNRTGQDLIICLGFSITRRAARAIWKRGNKEGEKFLAVESVNSLRISAPQWWPLREGRDGKCEGRNEKCEFLARESVSSSPIVRVFGKWKCEFIANRATMVTSLPSLSLSLYLSLSLSLSLSHRKYLTHNIGSASALPIIRSCQTGCPVYVS